MVAVLEVITYLEKWPITKEALEETRLGKLINDVRKKTKDEDLAKRAKKLLRNWQKLIEPGQTETPSRGPTASALGSANGGSHPCRPDSTPTDVSLASKGVPEVKLRNDVHNTYSPKAEKSSSRKRRGEQRESSMHLPAKISKLSPYEQQMHNSVLTPPTNGISGCPEAPPDQEIVPSPDRPRTEHLDNDKHSRIPVNAVKPHPSSPCVAKPPSTSSLLKTAVMQQQARMDEGGGGGGAHYQARSPRCLSSTSPRSMKQPETLPKRSSTYAPKGTSTVPSPSSRAPPSPLSQPLSSPTVQVSFSGSTPPSSSRSSSMHWAASSVTPSHLPQSVAATLDPLSVSPPSSLPPPLQHNPELHRPSSSPLSFEALARAEAESSLASTSERKRRKKYRSRDYSVNLQGQETEDTTKPVRLKERRITFDPVTGQIKPMVHREPSQSEEAPRTLPELHSAEARHRTDPPVSQLQQQSFAPTPIPVPAPSPFQQTNWKELSRNEIIQSYLNLQSNVLTSQGVQAPSAHTFMSEYLKREEHDVKEGRKTHVLQTSSSAVELPGVTRDVTKEDLSRVHTEHWPGVNGCFDTQGTWYDWTECISLDPHGDESRLNILPYVCFD